MALASGARREIGSAEWRKAGLGARGRRQGGGMAREDIW